MRDKGLEHFKCVQIHSEEFVDVAGQKAVEQRFVTELCPTLNTNNVDGLRNNPPDAVRVLKIVDELREYNSVAEKERAEYQHEYQKTYHPDYYIKNKARVKANCKKYSEVNKERISAKKKAQNAAIIASKTHYCDCCDLACSSKSALKIHGRSKRHLAKAQN